MESRILQLFPFLYVAAESTWGGIANDPERLDRLMRKYVHPRYAPSRTRQGLRNSVMKAAMEILGMPAGPGAAAPHCVFSARHPGRSARGRFPPKPGTLGKIPSAGALF